MRHPKEPTDRQCGDNARLEDFKGRKAFACWYPQMGGYVAKAVVVIEDEDDGCFEAFVWHNGEFPFSEEGELAGSPARIHHCMPSQFIGFGQRVLAMQGSDGEAMVARLEDELRRLRGLFNDLRLDCPPVDEAYRRGLRDAAAFVEEAPLDLAGPGERASGDALKALLAAALRRLAEGEHKP